MGWKSRFSSEASKYTQERMPSGGTRSLTLYRNKHYTVEEIIKIGRELFSDNRAKVLLGEATEIKLGYNNDVSISSFSINHEEVGLWNYYKAKNVEKIHLYLLSTTDTDIEELFEKIAALDEEDNGFQSKKLRLESTTNEDLSEIVTADVGTKISSSTFNKQSESPVPKIPKEISVPQLKGEELQKFMLWKCNQYDNDENCNVHENSSKKELSLSEVPLINLDNHDGIGTNSNNLLLKNDVVRPRTCNLNNQLVKVPVLNVSKTNVNILTQKNEKIFLECSRQRRSVAQLPSNKTADQSSLPVSIKEGLQLFETRKENKFFNFIEVLYLVTNESKYQDNILFSERNRISTAWHFLDNNEEEKIDVENFFPWEYGYEISKIIINNKVMLQLEYDLKNNKIENKKYVHPDVKYDTVHRIIRDVDEIVGFESNHLGIGFIPSCPIQCRPYFKWFRNNQVYREGFFLFWISFIPSPLESSEDIWHCNVTCTSQCSLTSKKLKLLNNQTFSIELDTRKIDQLSRKDFIKTEEIIGCGQQGTVYKGLYKSEAVAIKVINSNPRSVQRVEREVKIVKAIKNHKNFITLLGVCMEEKCIYLVMEYFEGKNLRCVLSDDKLKEEFAINEEKKFSIASQICKAVFYLHSQEVSIIHRDIKPENILIDKNGLVKICDFTLSKFTAAVSNLTATISAQGSKLYMAPELLLDDDEEATTFSDVWSTACTIVELYNEDSVWDVETERELKKLMKKKEFPLLKNLPEQVQAVIVQCFNYTKEERSTIAEMVQVFDKGST